MGYRVIVRRVVGLVALVLMAFAVSPALAQQVVGRGEVNGREIVIYDNGTWDFAAGGGSGPVKARRDPCAGLFKIESENAPLTYCLNSDNWVRNPPEGAFEGYYRTQADDIYFGVIVETVQLELKPFRQAILTNAQQGAGLNEIEVRREGQITVNGTVWQTIDYVAEIGELTLSFRNFYMSENDVSIQAIFWTEERNFQNLLPQITAVAETLTLRFSR